VSVPTYFRLPIVAIFASALIAAQVGCRGKARNDLYRQKMANEIRILEDQLYNAEYQNRVLRDNLEKSSTTKSTPSTASPSSTADGPQVAPELPSLDNIDAGQGFDPDELALPEIEEGSAATAEDELALPKVEEGSATTIEDELSLPTIDEGAPVDPEALTDPGAGAAGESGEGDAPMLPAPGGPEPPSKRDTEAPQVIPGQPAPPAAPGEEIKPPGQVVLPDSIQSTDTAPDQLRIHKGLSGGHLIDEKTDGLMIVVNAVDRLGRMVSLDNFDINAELTIVILDPLLEPSQARIGRWEYSNQQVSDFLRSKPISGLHVPIDWSDARPSGEEVIVHVRLRAENDEMRCEGRVSVEKETAVAQWTPRGESLK
jgi:hypothetical protein